MIIALDFDDTYTADRELWHAFIKLAELNGHKVYCVTCRFDTEENREIVKVEGIATYNHYFTGHSPKRWFMERRGVKVDVWIDDFPECVKEGR